MTAAAQALGRAKLLVLVGPTGVGKTALSLELALRFEGEIVSADSRLVYCGMDIGTDKPGLEVRGRVPHHMVDVCWPDETLSLGQYKRMAMAAIESVHGRNHLPLLVGGTGQYVRAIVEGWRIPEVAPQKRLRRALEHLGGPELYRWLSYLDPASAASIEARNVRRVVRALEVTLLIGRPMSLLQRREPPQLDISTIGLWCDRQLLYERIDARVDKMISTGFVEEVQQLRDHGYKRTLPAMSGLGYRQVWAFLDGETTLEECVERIKFETHRFARQQHNWFRRDDPDIKWYDVQSLGWQSLLLEDVEQFLS
jgi:tRNA dimethylallyltransferase